MKANFCLLAAGFTLALCGCDKISSLVQQPASKANTPPPVTTGKISLAAPRIVESDENKIREQISGRAAELLASGNYDQLEEFAERCRTDKTEFSDGGRKLTAFYAGLFHLEYTAPEASWQNQMARLAKWMEQRPEVITPRVALAEAWTSYAWKARGTGWAKEVSGNGWKLFGERLARAGSILMEARKLKARCPRWYMAAMTVALGEGWSRDDFEKLYNEAVQYDPGYLGFPFAKAYHLLPRWYGKPGEWEQFIASVADQRGGEDGDILYARLVWTMENRKVIGDLFYETKVSWPRTKKGFQALQKRFPDSLLVVSEFCSLAGHAGDRPTMQALFAQVDGRVELSVWESTSRYLEDRGWAFHGMTIVDQSQSIEKPTRDSWDTIQLKNGQTISGRIAMRIGSIVYVTTAQAKEIQLNTNDIVLENPRR